MLLLLLQASTLGLMDDIGLQRVVNSALADLRWARARYAHQVGIDWDRVVRQLNKDISAANDRLPDDKQVCSLLPVSHCAEALLALRDDVCDPL